MPGILAMHDRAGSEIVGGKAAALMCAGFVLANWEGVATGALWGARLGIWGAIGGAALVAAGSCATGAFTGWGLCQLVT